MPMPKFVRLTLNPGIYEGDTNIYINPEMVVSMQKNSELVTTTVTMQSDDVYQVTEDVETIKARIEGVYT